MGDADVAKALLLGKDTLKVVSNSASIKFFMRYGEENKKECKKFLKQVDKFITQLYHTKKYWYFFDDPYGDSVMLFEVRNSSKISDIYGRWEYLENFIKPKE